MNINELNAAKECALEKILDADRVLKGSRMIPTDLPCDQITDDQRRQVVEAVKAYLKEKSYPQSKLAKSLVLAGSTVSQVLKGSYGADDRPIIAAMDRWLERRMTADEQPQINRFIWTDVAKQIRIAAKRAMAAADAGIDSRISLVWGDPGCGKSLALEAIAQSEDAILLTCGVSMSSPRAILECIGKELRIPLGFSRREAFGNVVDRLRGSGKLILVDEIHSLLSVRDDEAFHTLRRISDETGCPQLWAATCNLLEELRLRERKREPLGQIISRIGSQFHLTGKLHTNHGRGKPEPLYSVEEVLQMFGSNEMKLTRDAARFLARFCVCPVRGLLRACTGLVAHATAMNRIKGGAITERMLWEAITFLFQDSVVAEIQEDLREELAELKLRVG